MLKIIGWSRFSGKSGYKDHLAQYAQLRPESRLCGRIPTVKLKIPGKSIFKIRNQNFYFIQVVAFDLSYLPVAAVGTWQVRYHEKNVKNIIDVFHNFTGFQKCFSRNFQFHRRDPNNNSNYDFETFPPVSWYSWTFNRLDTFDLAVDIPVRDVAGRDSSI